MTALAINGNRVRSVELGVPRVGLWTAIVHVDAPAELANPIALTIGATTLTGTLLADYSGTYLVKTAAIVLGGFGGWRKSVTKKHYHSDGGVSKHNILTTTATECGEQLSSDLISGAAALMQQHNYTRRAEAAVRVLKSLAPDWWVDFDGVTHTTARAASVPAAGVEILDFDPAQALATFRVTEVTDLAIGATISDRLDRPRTAQALKFVFDREARAYAWLA